MREGGKTRLAAFKKVQNTNAYHLANTHQKKKTLPPARMKMTDMRDKRGGQERKKNPVGINLSYHRRYLIQNRAP